MAYFGEESQLVLFDNSNTVVIERDAYGAGEYRFHRQLVAVAEEYSFCPRLCRPYRAKTKGKVERFNGYLKSSFLVPLAATLHQSGLKLDLMAANAHIGPWLVQVANNRLHGTTGEKRSARMEPERAALRPLPILLPAVAPASAAIRAGLAVPHESLQHPLSIYDSLLQVA